MRSNYILAGCETIFTILDNFYNRNTKNAFHNQFTKEQVSSFFSQSIFGGLHSFGQNFTGKKKYGKYVAMEADVFKQIRNSGFFNDYKLLADSGGFQVSVGRLEKKETELLIKLYHEFLTNHYESFDRAFILDLPPGPGCKIFNSFDDVYAKNLETYHMAKNLPQEARDKIIYIHHFRSPKLWDIYSKILNEDGMFDAFKYHATGGIIANMTSDTAIPCIIYVIPMIPLINKAIECGRSYLKFHVLGGANHRDILFYELFRKVVMEKHHIDLEITYDSSGLYKGMMVGRYLHNLGDDGIIRKVDIRSKNLDKRFSNRKFSVLETYQDMLEYLTNKYGFQSINTNQIYDETTGTFFEDIKIYSMFYMLDMFSRVQTQMADIANDLYPLYLNGDYASFNYEIELIARNINAGRITRKQKAKAYSVVKSLDMLTNLDEDYCKYLVNKHLAKDEFVELDSRMKTMTI